MTASRGSGEAGVPASVMVLGAGGVVPFLGISVALWLAPAKHINVLATALVAYAAVILSFLGAVHWGLAMARPAGDGWRWYGLGVAPALVAWGATWLAPAPALGVLVLAFAGALALDLSAVAAGRAPRWYRSLRVPLSLAVMACLALGGAAVWVSGP